MKIEKKLMLACTNNNGRSDIFSCTVSVTAEQIDLGAHYELAKALARENNYREPFVCFDEQDQINIAREVSSLDCQVPFKLVDKSNDEDEVAYNGNLLFGWDGISVQLNGFSDYTSNDDQGIVAYLECFNGEVSIMAYADINSEEPTDIIRLEGAKNSNRLETCNFD